MDSKRVLIRPSKPAALACALAAALLLGTALASAQDAGDRAGQGTGQQTGQAEQPGFFAAFGRWLDRQAAGFNAGVKHAGKGFAELGHDAGVAARTTVDNAKNTADAIVRLPKARVVSGHVKCRLAPNGAPDCVAAADHICKSSGYSTGKSLDMTTAEICQPKVYLAGRNSGPGCHTETFVSRALCQ